jgi:hypothetical protein
LERQVVDGTTRQEKMNKRFIGWRTIVFAGIVEAVINLNSSRIKEGLEGKQGEGVAQKQGSEAMG